MAISSNDVLSSMFPAGISVFAIDEDIKVLQSIEQMCMENNYQVTACNDCTFALNLVNDGRLSFDIILIDVRMSNTDGYEFLRHAFQDIDICVSNDVQFAVMSDNDDPNVVLESINDGACDFWIKPLREEQIKNIWRHVARKVLNDKKEQTNLGSLENNNDQNKRNNDSEVNSYVIDATEGVQTNSNLNEADESES
ncbi:two-component response regulator ORR21-like [Abrus precatorius]|uniref:Two-component response regulator ORR21-like n=1 Tax=Abrus precatorius TaxID=3816 RepID=A0A8B8KHG1_ABRPR|nr:two-component response regulator ORR21-like [Abrus precatorius]